MREALKRTFLKNSVEDFLIVLGLILVGIVVIQIVKKVVIARLKKVASKTDTNYDDFILSGIQKFIIPVLYYAVIYFSLNYLTLTKKVEEILAISTTVVITYLIIRLFSTGIGFFLKSHLGKQDRGEEKIKQLGGLMLIINAVIWIVGLVFLFNNMGYNVSAVITGLGIGGIAVALAAQNILGDLFNYFVIFFDRPFEIGDFISVDNKMGTVDYIGIKTTRVKSLTGEQLIFSNSDLTNSRIHNYKRMETRRTAFQLSVTYSTDVELIRTIPKLLRSIVEAQKEVRFDRAHFSSYGDSGLIFEVVYIVLSSDYNRYMDIQQEVNLRIFEEFSEREIDFAFPSRSLYIMNDLTRSEEIRNADEKIFGKGDKRINA